MQWNKSIYETISFTEYNNTYEMPLSAVVNDGYNRHSSNCLITLSCHKKHPHKQTNESYCKLLFHFGAELCRNTCLA